MSHTEELLGSILLDNVDKTGLQLLNDGNVVGQNTHLARVGGDVDLDDILGLVDGLRQLASIPPIRCAMVLQLLNSFVQSGGIDRSAIRFVISVPGEGETSSA